MVKTFIFNFDGTGNAPNDANPKERFSWIGGESDITNVLKLHLLSGGSLAKQGVGWNNQQQSFYYAGIGTYGSLVQRTWNALFAPEGSDIKHILSRALKDFNQLDINPICDRILITGFSRGAALARRFAALLSTQLSHSSSHPCLYLIAFDTVASIGRPNLSQRERPRSDVVFENRTLAPAVIKALHLVALDEKREAFQPTLMNREDRVTEVWFAGAHSNVGGGYRQDGLSDVALQFCLDWLAELPLDIELRKAVEIDYSRLKSPYVDFSICPTRIELDANPLCRNHQQDRWLLAHRITLSDRLCCVIEEDEIAPQYKPLVHESVIERMVEIENYRPSSLSNIEFLTVED